ncbi:hypothetical protein GN956_G2763 [Arapaima gigas]
MCNNQMQEQLSIYHGRVEIKTLINSYDLYSHHSSAAGPTQSPHLGQLFSKSCGAKKKYLRVLFARTVSSHDAFRPGRGGGEMMGGSSARSTACAAPLGP